MIVHPLGIIDVVTCDYQRMSGEFRRSSTFVYRTLFIKWTQHKSPAYSFETALATEIHWPRSCAFDLFYNSEINRIQMAPHAGVIPVMDGQRLTLTDRRRVQLIRFYGFDDWSTPRTEWCHANWIISIAFDWEAFGEAWARPSTRGHALGQTRGQTNSHANAWYQSMIGRHLNISGRIICGNLNEKAWKT